MKINLPATREKFLNTGRAYAAFARVKGQSVPQFTNFMGGFYVPKPGGVVETRYFEILAEIDCLVLAEEQEAA
jgi:hypothetical protein